MLDRLLFALRRSTLDLGQRLGSWRLSIVLIVLLGQYYAFLAIWGRSSPSHVVQNIASLAPFWLLYGLLLVNTGVCLWNRLSTLRREIGKAPRLVERPPDWELPAPDGTDADGARRILRGMGFRRTAELEGRVWGVRRRRAALGTFLFHGAFFVVALGFLATFVARQEARVWVAVGEEYSGDAGQVLSLSAPRVIGGGVPAFRFSVERILPEFWGDLLLFTTLEADLEFPDGSKATTRINRPLWVGPWTFLRMSGFGYAPLYEILDRDGRVLDGAFVKLNVFPPGQRDFFNLPGYPHRVYLEVLPDPVLEGGGAATQTLNLVDPAVDLHVYRGRLDLGGALLRSHEGFSFEGLTLRFPEIRYWGEFSIVRDPGAPLLFSGYLLGLAGLLLRVRGKRAEAEWSPGPDGEAGRLRGWGGKPPSPRRIGGGI